MAWRALLVSFEEAGFAAAPRLAARLLGAEPAAWLHLVAVAEGHALRRAPGLVQELRGGMAERAGALVHDGRLRLAVRMALRPQEEVARCAAEAEADLVAILAPAATWGGTVPWVEELLESPPTDLALILLPDGFSPAGWADGRCGAPSDGRSRVWPDGRCLVAVRGGPYAELALRLGRALAGEPASVTVLHLLRQGVTQAEWWHEEPFLTLLEDLGAERRIYRSLAGHSPPAAVEEAVAEEAAGHAVILVGASGPPESEPASPDWRRLAEATGLPVAVVRTKAPIGRWLDVHLRPWTPEETDKWFAEHTFAAAEFADLAQLVRLKERQGVTVSLCVPVLNEEATVGGLVRTMRSSLLEEIPLLDEIVVVDSGSEDASVRVARGEGARVHLHRDVLPELGSFAGKGEALWKSLYVVDGDIVVFLDGDIRNPDPAMVYGLVGPLLRHPDLHYVKGYFRRPLRIGGRRYEAGGGRVTELVARPLLNLFYPELSGFIQPLAGPAAGRRRALASVPFLTGWGVEAALLIDLQHRLGLPALAQVDLGRIVHRNKPLAELTPMAFAVARAVVARLERHGRLPPLPPLHKALKLVESGPPGPHLDLLEIEEHERPPMETVPAYRRRFSA